MNSTLKLLNNRMSLRKYADMPIKEEDLELIIKGAMRAPTAGNMMLYSIIVIKDKEKMKKLSETCDNQPFIGKAPISLIFLADMQRIYDYFAYCDLKEFCREKGIEYKEPGFAGLFLAVSDALIAAQNAVIAAESLGIGSCYIGDIMENYEIHKELFDLPDKVFPIGMLCLGYYSKQNKRIISPRFNRKYIVFEEKYKMLSNEDFRVMYKDNEMKVSPQNIHGAKNFGQFLYSRKFGTKFFEEMERSINVIIDHWKGQAKK
ncbi:nitroreductase family protein [Maledivibacter halophilus]|uniref:FMN reductase (NADPH) n=1 Tax=Maledivibacter halophilus TaxID=36842 RepID=A0A1T5ICT3_9FIRM|nr:nitroreductase family protein [Maledivibacter halophilus]SKC37011.1 FMN reductase (NADPH) [Maledivibacter halophilus]